MVVGTCDRISLAALECESLPLVFGRIDRNDGEHAPLVVDWRAPVAEPFYRATPHEPLGLLRRRHFRTRGRRLLGMDDERFGPAEAMRELPWWARPHSSRRSGARGPGGRPTSSRRSRQSRTR
ncbi:MAG: hypothetical protein ACRDYA_15430 [Egibacteraceae bacterium]